MQRLLIAGVALLAMLLACSVAVQRPQLQLTGNYNSYRCPVHNSSSGGTFQVLTLTGTGARQLSEQLCAEPAMARHAGFVEVYWYPRGYLNAQQLVDQQFDLIWNRQHIIFGLVPDLLSYYEILLESPQYRLFFISHHSPPQLTHDWFSGKSLGLLSDSHSQSFFLQPLGALEKAGLRLAEEEKIYFPDIASLIDAFRTGKLDVISAPEGMVNTLDLDPVYRTTLASDVPSGSWFLSRSRTDHALRCGLLKALDNFDSLLNHDASAQLAANRCEALP